MKRIIFFSIFTCVLVFQSLLNAQTTYTAVVYGGNWQDPGTWSPEGVPGPDDYVVVIDQLVIITGQHEIAGFTLDWGTFAGTIKFDGGGNPSLTVTGNSTWGAGIFDGGNGINGNDSVNNTLLFTETSEVTMTDNPGGHNFHYLDFGTHLINKGTIILQGNGFVGGRGFSTLHNEGLFDIQGDGDFDGASFNGGTFINTGTLRKSGGTGVSTINGWWTFENQNGIIDLQAGTLQHSGSGIYENGTYSVSENAALTFTGGTWVFRGNLNSTPAGEFSLNGGTISTDSLAVTFDIQGTGFQFVYGTINGGGTLLIPEGALFVLPGTNYAGLRAGTTLLNQGTVKQAGTYAFGIQGNSIVENQSLWEITSDADLSGGTGSGGTFKNTGTLLKSGGSDITFIDAWWNFKNEGGTIEVQSGTIEYRGGIYNFNGGTYSVAEGATLTLTGGTCTVSGTLSGSPEGVFSLNGTATISTDSANVTFNIKGSGFQFTKGTINGGGTLIIPEDALLVLPGIDYAVLNGGTSLLNQGTVKHFGTNAFRIQGNSIVDNQSLWDITSDAGFSGLTGSGGTFNNTGIFRKSGGTNVTSINGWWAFFNKNGAIIDVASGEIEFTTNNNFENEPGGIIQGVGTIKVPSNFTNNGITAPGNSAGMLSYIGNFLPSATAVLDVQLGGVNQAEYDQLNVTGSAKLNGTLKVYLTNGFIPAAGDSFVVLTTTSAITDSFVTFDIQSGLYLSIKKNANNVTLVVDSVGTISSLENETDNRTITSYELSQNYPNPFNPSTTIQFALPQAAFVSLEVFNIVGERVDVLVSQELNSGKYNYEWNGLTLTSGVYFYRLQAGNFVETKKMLLIK